VLSFPLTDNLVLTDYHSRPSGRGIVRDEAAIAERAEEAIARFDVRTPAATVSAGTLSGGNQQKIIVAREFGRDLKRSSWTAHARAGCGQRRVHHKEMRQEA
jgi:simple sugar transport system ATP-binding protein